MNAFCAVGVAGRDPTGRLYSTTESASMRPFASLRGAKNSAWYFRVIGSTSRRSLTFPKLDGVLKCTTLITGSVPDGAGDDGGAEEDGTAGEEEDGADGADVPGKDGAAVAEDFGSSGDARAPPGCAVPCVVLAQAVADSAITAAAA